MTDRRQQNIKYLWWREHDTTKNPEQVLNEAVLHYTKKYGQAPVRVLVPVSFPDLNGSTPVGLVIERNKNVQPCDLWLSEPTEAQVQA